MLFAGKNYPTIKKEIITNSIKKKTFRKYGGGCMAATYPLTGKLYDFQLGNNIKIKNANMHTAYKEKKKDFNEEQNTNLHGPWLFFRIQSIY